MLNWLRQAAAVARIKISGQSSRTWLSGVTMLALALVVVVLLTLLAMKEGFVRTVQESGAADVAVLMRTGAQSEINSVVTLEQARLIEGAPNLSPGADRRPLVSPELYMVVNAAQGADDRAGSIALRGMDAKGVAIRSGARVVEGRIFRPGQQEIVVGRALMRAHPGFAVGRSVRLGGADWTIVGVFSAGGALESEVWADIGVVGSLFKRTNSVQTVRVKLADPDRISDVARFVAADPRLQLDVQSERAFYAAQATQTSDLIQKLGWPLGLAMSIGALVSALSTMQASVDAHASELITLRTIGFGSLATFCGNMVEALGLGLVGASCGLALTYLCFDGLSASTIGSGLAQISFRFEITPQIAAEAFLLALAAGILGGVLPSWRTSRERLVGRAEV